MIVATAVAAVRERKADFWKVQKKRTRNSCYDSFFFDRFALPVKMKSEAGQPFYVSNIIREPPSFATVDDDEHCVYYQICYLAVVVNKILFVRRDSKNIYSEVYLNYEIGICICRMTNVDV
jgi:hypothetical protein